MNHFNLLMVLQTLVDFFEGYFLQQFYGDFFAERFRRKSWNQMGVVIAYVMFQYIKKLFLPTDYRMFYITENLVLSFFFLLFLSLCFYKNMLLHTSTSCYITTYGSICLCNSDRELSYYQQKLLHQMMALLHRLLQF